MLLIGMFDSPFVRRVAITLKLMELPFEHANWSIGRDFDRIRDYNPLGRVPTLITDDGETLMESGAILDYLDERAGPERALLPRSGAERRRALNLMAMATGAAEKGVLQIYERVFRPEDKRHAPWTERCRTQMNGSLAALDRYLGERGVSQWLVGKRMTQADITAVCVFTFLDDALKVASDPVVFQSLGTLSARCESLPVFQETRVPFLMPAG
ncbi:MAG TPA: glutathione S-transferase family protein [Steroidobacteraceae bacterium]|jgi:glutathione S-transferase|nr:glutathione S-transferase family protein [Steroidobacteraceae bacterium]